MTTTPVYSERWFRVSELRPRLPSTVRVHRQVVRGEVWHLLSGGGRQPSYRVDASGWSFVGRCDGRRSVADIWRAILDDDADDSPTQDEIINLMIRMHEAELLDVDSQANVAALERRRGKRRRKARHAKLNPMAFRATLGDPTRWLERLGRLPDRLFSRAGLALWCVLIAIGVGTWISNWDDTAEHARRWLTTPRYLLIAWLCYPVIKLIHEASHALAIRRWGGEVREVGLALVFLTPLPYVDASAANLLPRRTQRAIVSAAGIAAELALAAASLILWAWLEPGLPRDVMFSIALTGSLSTLLFNANPLMRLDGYYLMCDLLHLPNLAMRSGAWWHAAIVRHGLGLKHRQGPRATPAERRWLVLYAPLSWGYRLLASAWLVLWAGASHPVLGALAAVLMLSTVVVMPIYRSVGGLLRDVPADRRRYRARLRLAACTAALATVVMAVPLPDRLLAQGVVWVPEEGHLRAGTAGFLESLVADGEHVEQGRTIATLASIELQTEIRQLLARREGLRTGIYQSLIEDPYKSRQIQEEIVALDERIRLNTRQREGLMIPAGASGRLAIARPQDQPGRFIRRGDDLGLIEAGRTTTIRVAIEQEDAARLSTADRAPVVRLAARGDEPVSGRIVRIDPAAVDKLPGAALATAAGGSIVTDPTDTEHLRPLRPVRLVDVEVPLAARGISGSRAWVRFDFGTSSLAAQALRAARQQLLVRFSPLES